MMQWEKLYKIMDACSPAWGVCTYAGLDELLLPCAAKKRIPPGTQRVIVTLSPYALAETHYHGSNLSRYAVVPDYHEVVSGRLKEACAQLQNFYPAQEFAPFVDHSPFPEVRAAALAGLGVIGQNGLLFHPRYGSYVFIGEIATTLAVPETKIGPALPHCPGCGLCQRACPNSALPAVGSTHEESGFQRERCLSHITQKKGTLTNEEETLIRESGCVWGCDICQRVCPLNAGISIEPLPEFVAGSEPRAHIGQNSQGRAWAFRGVQVIERNLRLCNGNDQ